MLTPEEANGVSDSFICFLLFFLFFHSNNLQPKNALLDPNRKWPNAIVPYVIVANQYSNHLLSLLTEATN
jgi:hypothetical protein